MGKVGKTRKRKKFLYNVNRRKLKNKSKKKVEPRIPCDAIREAWNPKKHTKANLESMGLAYKVNTVIPMVRKSENSKDPVSTSDSKVANSAVVTRLEEQASKPRERRLRLPKEKVRFVESMMDSHNQDFVRMARDPRNHYQLTPKQIRQLLLRYWDIPEHFAPYMKRKGLLTKPEVAEQDDE